MWRGQQQNLHAYLAEVGPRKDLELELEPEPEPDQTAGKGLAATCRGRTSLQGPQDP